MIGELGFVWDFLNPNSRVSAKTIKLGTRLEDRCVTYCHNEDNGNLPQEQRANTHPNETLCQHFKPHMSPQGDVSSPTVVYLCLEAKLAMHEAPSVALPYNNRI